MESMDECVQNGLSEPEPALKIFSFLRSILDVGKMFEQKVQTGQRPTILPWALRSRQW